MAQWPGMPSLRRAAPSAWAGWPGKTTRLGLCKCYGCRKPFTVRMGTIFECQHLPLASVAANHPSDVRQQEGHFDQPDPADAPVLHENRLVPEPPYPGRDGRKAGVSCSPSAARARPSRPTKPTSAARRQPGLRGAPAPKNAVLSLVERGGGVRFHVHERYCKLIHAHCSRSTFTGKARFMTDEARSIPASAGIRRA